MTQQQIQCRRKAIHFAVMASLMSAGSAFAACSGSVASPYSTSATLFCTGSDGNLTNNANISSTLSISNSNNALIQFEGLGKTLTNTGTIDNSSTLAAGATANRTRYGVFMGTATVADTSFGGATPGSGAVPAVGATTVTIKTGLPSTAVGQTITFGRLDSSGGDFFAGETRTIIAYDSATGVATLDSALSTNYAGSGSASLPVAYNVVSGSGVNTINNQVGGVIAASIGATEIVNNISGNASRSNTSSAKAISMDIAGDYVINNSGTIRASHAGVGGLTGIDGGGAVTSLTINNSGTIAINRTSTLTLADNSATSLTVTTSTSGSLIKQSLGSAAAVYSQEELESITLNNDASGVIEATGNFTPAVYLRAGEQSIVNEGIIRSNTANGFAIGSVSDSGEIRTLGLDNSGTITGDILAVNGNAVRWYTLSTLGTIDNRLAINSNWGQLDSTISNSGTITGNLHYSNGTHELTNTEGATLTGNIDVDQRNTTCTGCSNANPGDYTVRTAGTNTSGDFTVVGSKTFTFENAGDFNGDLTVRTQSSTVVGLDKTVTSSSQITLIPTITGTGEGSSQASPSDNISGMGNTLKIWDGATSSIAATTTLKPTVAEGVFLKSGEWFKVANTLYGDALPQVEAASALVSWEAAKNAGGNLVVGASVADASTISGVSGNGARAINALMTSGSSLGAEVQQLQTASQVSSAGEQLRPEVNGATYQTTMNVSNAVLGVLNTRFDQNHLAQLSGSKTGIASGDQPGNTGVWLQGFGSNTDQNRYKQVDGYDADTYGFGIGADTLLGEAGNLRVGGSFNYASSNVDYKGVNDGNHNDFDSYIGTLYGSMRMDGWYLNGVVGTGEHKYDTKRNVLNNTVKGSFDAWQYFAHINAGMPFKVGFSTLTPIVGATYSRLNQDGYTERGVGALKIGSEDTNSFRSLLGGKALLPVYEGNVNTEVELHALWSHEFADTDQSFTASYVGGGGAFTTQGVNPDRNTYNVGATLRLAGSDKDLRQSLDLTYDAEIKDQYLSQTALLRARFEF